MSWSGPKGELGPTGPRTKDDREEKLKRYFGTPYDPRGPEGVPGPAGPMEVTFHGPQAPPRISRAALVGALGGQHIFYNDWLIEGSIDSLIAALRQVGVEVGDG